MGVEPWVWAATLVTLTAVLLADLIIIGRRPHEPSLGESSLWICVYVAAAIAFGVGIWLTTGTEYASQFYGGWLTEYSLSVDNLFVFVFIMARFAVPRQFQQRVLLVGIIVALLLRGVFIAAGAALINQFVWIFYLFGGFLLYTAIKLISQGAADESDYEENFLVNLCRRIFRISKDYDPRARLVARDADGRIRFTPIIVVMVAIGTTDLVFALDSIPAIFGLTKEPYIVYTANVFALMGLRQLYFLLGGLLDRLRYLSVGLAIILAFIGVKLVLEALHANNLPFVNGGRNITWIPEVTIEISLAVIVSTLAVTTAISLTSSRKTHRVEEATTDTQPQG
jgi:tellurite resistance protein TerC